MAEKVWLLLVPVVFFFAPSSQTRADTVFSNGTATTIPYQSAKVDNTEGGTFNISWRAPGVHHVNVYVGADPNHVGRNHKVASGSENGNALIEHLPPKTRWYFEFVPDAGYPLVLADRSLHLPTASNFRDIGGYRTTSGKWVRMSLAYRSNELNHLTQTELDKLDTLHIKFICDLRTDEEIQRNPDRIPVGAGFAQNNVLADDADKIHAYMTGTTPPTGTDAHKHATYRDFVSLPSAKKGYHQLFERLAHRNNLPMIFHCSAGKDRTGWGDAVLLTILGVPRSTIVQDYILTNQYLRGVALKNLRRSFPSANLKQVIADPADLDAAFEEVIQRYHTFDNYLHNGLGLDDATLDAIRKNFLVG